MLALLLSVFVYVVVAAVAGVVNAVVGASKQAKQDKQNNTNNEKHEVKTRNRTCVLMLFGCVFVVMLWHRFWLFP